MVVTIKKQTQPDVVSANLVLYSKEENDKMLNDPELKERLNNGELYLSSELLNENNNGVLMEPETLYNIGVVKEIRYDSIDVEMDYKNYNQYINDIENGVFVAGMRMGVDNTVIDDNGIMLLKGIKITCFDLIYDNTNKDIYYEMQTPIESFRNLFNKLYRNISNNHS